MTRITYQSELLFQCVLEAQPLIAAHHAEVEMDRPGFIFAVDWGQYRRAEEAGVLHIITARQEGEMVGYVTAMIAPHRHSAGAIHAQGDLIYLKPRARKGRTAFDLHNAAETHFKNKGATYLSWSAKMGSTLEKLLPRLGYQPEEIVYGKPL